MAKLNKEQCIQVLTSNYGYTKKKLDGMKVTAMRKLITTEKRKADSMEQPKDKKSKKSKASAEEKKEFKSYCGSDFDPAKHGSCEKQCKQENPDSYTECVEHYKQTAKARRKSAAGRKAIPKNTFGHRVNSAAAKIDELLINGSSVDKMADKLDTTTGRIRNHIDHLRRNGFDVTHSKETGFFYLDNPELNPVGQSKLVKKFNKSQQSA